MKQLKFLTTVSLEGKPVWYKDHIYEVMSEGSNGQGREIYKLICEDLQPRGIDKVLANKMYKLIELEDKVETIKEPEIKKEDITISENEKSDVLSEEKVVNSEKKQQDTKPKNSSNKKKKSYKN